MHSTLILKNNKAPLEVRLNWKWFIDYFDILKKIYKHGHFLLHKQSILAWSDSIEELIEESKKRNLVLGHFSIQGFDDIEKPFYYSNPNVIF